MNKLLKAGLWLQLPNVLAMIGGCLFYVGGFLNWSWIFDHAGLIAALTPYVIVNIISIVLIIMGAIKEYNSKEKKNKHGRK